MPRPKKDIDQSRTKRLPHVRVTEAELLAVKDNARAAGLSLSAYQRRMCLDGKVTVRGDRRKVDVVLMRDINAIGNNLNQLTRMEHIHAEYDHDRLRRLLDILDDIAARIIEDRRL